MLRLLLLLCVMTAFPTMALAHAMGLDCTLRGDHVVVEVFFDDDSPAEKAKVQVFNSKEEVIATGMTDQDGRWSFRKPAAGKYEVRADATGHRAKKSIEIKSTDIANEPSTDVPIPIGEGPSRADATRFPWTKLAIGIVVIGGLAGAFMAATIVRRKLAAPRPSETVP